MPTYQQIVNDAAARRTDIINQEKMVQRQITTVSLGNSPTRDQDINGLTDTDTALITSREKLDLVTLQALDQTPELEAILDGLKAAVSTLQAANAAIVKWGDIADGVTSILGGLNDLIGNIQTVVATHNTP
jgi:hypothetical protein